MRVNVTDELRKLIINTMVNYVADGGDVNMRKSSDRDSLVGTGGGIAAGSSNKGGRGGGKGGWFGWLSCFTSRND